VGGLYHVLTRGNDRQTFSFRLSITTRRLPQGDLYDPTDRIVETYKQIEGSSSAIIAGLTRYFLTCGTAMVVSIRVAPTEALTDKNKYGAAY
jgi:hypothetical protein